MSTGLDLRSDLYNVGILLFEVLTCQRLFIGNNPSQYLQSMMRGHVPKLDVELGVPAELEALMRRALSKDREARPPNAAAFDAELAAIQRRYGMPAARARVEAEWRTLFGSEPDDSAREPLVGAPRRLASASAALPEVVARADVPRVRPRTPANPPARGDQTALIERTDGDGLSPSIAHTDPGDRPFSSVPRTGSSRPSGPRAVLLAGDPWAPADDRARQSPSSSPRSASRPASRPGAPRTPSGASSSSSSSAPPSAPPTSASHSAARKVIPHGSRVVPLDSEEPPEK
jgi:hypothetical protein